MKLTLEELINRLLEVANSRGGSVKTNVTRVEYQSPGKSDEHGKLEIYQSTN